MINIFIANENYKWATCSDAGKIVQPNLLKIIIEKKDVKKIDDKIVAKVLLLIVLMALMQNGFSQSGFKTVDMRCEYLTTPIGIDATQPRLSWRMSDRQQGARQMAYQILVGTDSIQLLKGKADMWQTNKVNTDASLVTYAGKSLQAFTKYYWRIDIWNKDNIKNSSFEISGFETGMMGMKGWQGAWISDNGNIHLKPAPYFRKAFTTSKK